MVESLASFILGIINFFGKLPKWFNDFYDDCADYIYRNIKNGRIFYDFGVVQKKIFILTLKFIIREYKSTLVQNQIFRLHTILKLISAIPVINKFLQVIYISVNIYKKNEKYFLIFQFLFILPIIILLINLLNSSPAQFFIYLIPIFLLILYIESSLYTYINIKERNEKISIINSFILCLSNFYSVILLFLFYILISASLIFILILLIIFLIQYITILENNIYLLFLFLLIIMFVCVSVIFYIFYSTILFYQSYFIAVLDKKHPVNAMITANSILRKNILKIYGYSVLIFIPAIMLELFAYFYFSDIALHFVNAFILHLVFLFFYSIRCIFVSEQLKSEKNIYEKRIIIFFFIILIYFGVIGYIALASMSLKYFSNVVQFYNSWLYDLDMSQNFHKFVNEENGYSIIYPKTWQLHQWNNKSVTFSYNVNKTLSGAISVNIEILPVSKTDYFRFEQLVTGTIIEDHDTKENFTMDAKLFLAGQNAVKYKVVKIQPGINRYEINYLILRGENVYKISFVTATSIFQHTYSKTFEAMINSFKFLR